MKVTIAGLEFDLNNEPTTEAVEKVLEYDQNLTMSMLDLSNLTDADKARDISEILTQQLTKNPEKLKKYMLSQKLNEPIKTIMLCTGLGAEDLKKVPLRPLYAKCKEVLGGSASDFFAELGMNTIIPIPVKKTPEAPQ